MRPVNLYEKPPFPPYVCVYCGVGEKPRKWFIDPGISLDYYFNPVNDGTPFICNECWDNLKVQIERLVNNWVAEHAGWESPDRVAASYKWKEDVKPSPRQIELEAAELLLINGDEEEDDVSGPEPTDGEHTSQGGFDLSSILDSRLTGDSEDTEPDDSELDSDESDDDAKSAFTALFGEQP